MTTISDEKAQEVLAEAFEHDEPEWLTLATPRERAVLATAIEEPSLLTDDEWAELQAGPTACGLRNLDSKAGVTVLVVGAAAAIGLSLFSLPTWSVNAALIVWLAGTIWFVISRARYQITLRRARRSRAWAGAGA